MNIIINTTLDHIPDGFEPIPHQGNYYHNILSCLGYPDDRPPVADLLRRYHSLEGQWLVASPIHWQATHNDAMIIASGDDLQLSADEGRRWFDVFQAWMSLENIPVFYHDANAWLIQCNNKPSLHAKPVYVLHDHSLISELRQLDSTFYWQRLITEGQMLLSEHNLNKYRGASPAINGVWFWGGGELDKKEQGVFVFSDEPSMALAHILSPNVGLATLACPDNSSAIPAEKRLCQQGDWPKSFSQTRMKPSMAFKGLRKAFRPIPMQPDFPSTAGIADNSLVLLDQQIPNELAFVKKQPTKQNTQWYWNNLACTRIKKKNWLSRILSLFL